jgi:sugar lactone lactonase YvrE
VHGRYRRRLTDVTIGGHPLLIELMVRRWRCPSPDCATVTFAEQISGLTSPHSRYTPTYGRADRTVTWERRSRQDEAMTFRVIPVPGTGAEDVVVALSGPDEGTVFTGTADGVIHRISPDGRRVDQVASTGGRPLGIEFLPDGRLLVCDARRGVLTVDVRAGTVETLFRDVGGWAMVFCNNAAVADDGTVYVSDSSTVHPIDRWKAEILELTRTGRLLRRTPDGQVDVLLDGLSFANGVALAGDGSFVAVAETAARTVVRYWLTGPAAGTRDHLATDLPGYPDNISRGSDGLVWVSIASPRDPLVERLQGSPLWLRRQVTKIPDRVQPAPKRTVRVQAYDDDGTLVYDLPVDDAELRTRFHMVTGVREHEGRVWMGSLHESAVAVLEP